MKQARKKGPDMYGKNALQVVGSKPDSIMQQAAHTAQHSTAQHRHWGGDCLSVLTDPGRQMSERV